MTNYIAKISIDEKSLIRSEKNKNARERAVTDLLDTSNFELKSSSGPYFLHVSIVENKLAITVSADEGTIENIAIPLSPLRRVIKDYHIICESYYDAVKVADPRRVEAIDMGRRGVHNEGSEIIEDLIGDKVIMDFETLRKLFSLIYVLQIK